MLLIIPLIPINQKEINVIKLNNKKNQKITCFKNKTVCKIIVENLITFLLVPNICRS